MDLTVLTQYCALPSGPELPGFYCDDTTPAHLRSSMFQKANATEIPFMLEIII